MPDIVPIKVGYSRSNRSEAIRPTHFVMGNEDYYYN